MSDLVCKFVFTNNPNRFYYSGQTVKGKAILTIVKATSVKGIILKVQGMALVRWRADDSNNCRPQLGERLYFNHETEVLRCDGGEITLEPGTREYEFHCELPIEIPSSMDLDYGHVRYLVKLTLERKTVFDECFSEQFKVYKRVKLDSSDKYEVPVKAEVLHKFGYILCPCLKCGSNGEVYISAQTQIAGFVPGQNIFTHIRISNSSSNEVYKITMQLVKILSYYANVQGGEKKKCEHIMREKVIGNCREGEAQTFETDLQVPSLLHPSDISSGEIVKVEYVLRIIASTGIFCQDDQIINLPITIGTEPIKNPPTHADPLPDHSSHFRRHYGSERQPLLPLDNSIYFRSNEI